MVTDIRHKPTALDKTMAEYFQQTGIPWLVAANKSDKLKPSQVSAGLDCIRETLALGPSVPLLPMSGEKGTGKDQVLHAILQKIQK